jgi:hypothetical protein
VATNYGKKVNNDNNDDTNNKNKAMVASNLKGQKGFGKNNLICHCHLS